MLQRQNPSTNIQDFEFKVFSQFGEDGIIQYLVNNVEIINKTFIEFGVGDFYESNCRYLLQNNNWSGFIIDSSAENIQKIKDSSFFWKYELECVAQFITKENINQILSQSNFNKDLGILSIDIDGNDYFILQSITTFNPRIIICEFNSIFGMRPITCPYKDNFNRTEAHFSNLYFGASLTALNYLATQKNYSLVGVNSNGINAFFIRNDLLNSKIKAVNIENIFVHSKIRQSRDTNGNLSFVSPDKQLNILRGMPVYNVITEQQEEL